MERSYLPAIADYIPRPRVDALYEKGLGYSLVLVAAGPGYGKTLSLAHRMRGADVRLVWMHASAYRTKAVDFWEDLVRAAGRELPEYARKLEEIGFPDSSGAFEQFRRLTARVAGEGKRLALVVDRYEKITDADTIRFIDHLIECDLANLTLFVLCNVMRPFAQVLPAMGMLRITDKDLAFTADEARMMFGHYGIKMTPGLVERALDAAGAWPLGLRLVCESVPENPEALSSRTPVQMVADLFEQHYFHNYPADVRTQLILLSLLPQFSMDMVREEMETTHTEFYEQLMQHPFVSCDYATGLFMFQTMYQEFLRGKQALVGRGAREETFRYAGRWFLDHGMTQEAMDSFWEAADYDGFLAAVAALPKMRKPVSITDRVLKRLEQIPRSYADENPMVDYSVAFMHLNAANAQRARELLLAVEERARGMPRSEERRLLLGDIYGALADICTFQNEDTGLEWMQKACALIPQGSRIHAPELMVLGNTSAFFLPDHAPGQLERMVDYFMAYARYADKVKNGCGHGFEFLFAGEAAFFKGEMDRAAAMLNSAMLKGQLTGQHDIVCNAMWRLARIELYYGNHKNALALLAEIGRYVEECDAVGLHELLDCATASIYMRLGDAGRIPPWFGEVMTGPEEMPLSATRRLLISAHYLYIRGDIPKAYATMLQLQAMLEHKGRWYERFCMYLLLAWHHLETGDPAAFEAAFRSAYDMVYANDMKVILADSGKPMMSLIDGLRRLGAGGYDMEWLDEVYRDSASAAKRIQIMRVAYNGGAPGQRPTALALTRRENETLRYLAQGLTQQEMAKLMGISSNAVKKHVSKIYFKLGAVNRADAIHIATINGLVDVLNS